MRRSTWLRMLDERRLRDSDHQISPRMPRALGDRPQLTTDVRREPSELQGRRSDAINRLDHYTKVVVARMERVHPRVRSLPSLVSGEESRASLRRLVTWFERICVDDQYSSPAPEDGIRAMSRAAHPSTGLSGDDVASARWAVHLADEVADCRSHRASGAEKDGVACQVALSRLEGYMSGCHQLSSKCRTWNQTAS